MGSRAHKGLTKGDGWLWLCCSVTRGHPMIRQTLAYVAYSVLLLVLLLTLLVSQASLPSSLSRVEPGLFALLPLAR